VNGQITSVAVIIPTPRRKSLGVFEPSYTGVHKNALHSTTRIRSSDRPPDFESIELAYELYDIFYSPTFRHPTSCGIPAVSSSSSDVRHVDDVISGRPTAKWVNLVLRRALRPVADMFISGYFCAYRFRQQRLLASACRKKTQNITTLRTVHSCQIQINVTYLYTTN